MDCRQWQAHLALKKKVHQFVPLICCDFLADWWCAGVPFLSSDTSLVLSQPGMHFFFSLALPAFLTHLPGSTAPLQSKVSDPVTLDAYPYTQSQCTSVLTGAVYSWDCTPALVDPQPLNTESSSLTLPPNSLTAGTTYIINGVYGDKSGNGPRVKVKFVVEALQGPIWVRINGGTDQQVAADQALQLTTQVWHRDQAGGWAQSCKLVVSQKA